MCFDPPSPPPPPPPPTVSLPEDPADLARRRAADARKQVTRDSLVIGGNPTTTTKGTGLSIV